MKDLYLDCFSGVAGDMFVGALLDLGASFDEVRAGLAKLGVSGYRLERRSVVRHAIAATKYEVILDGHEHGDPGAFASHAAPAPAHDDLPAEHHGEKHCGSDHDHGSGHDHGHGGKHTHSHEHPHGHDHHHDADHEHSHGHSHEHTHADGTTHSHDHSHDAARGLREIRHLIDGSGLPPRVRARALAAFTLLAEAEGKVHGKSAEEVHFHEVGAVDALCDVVGAAIALELLGVDRVFVGPLRTGSGFVKCAHGTMPIPAPGALGCLAGFDVRFEEGRGELITPTGACLVGALAKPLDGAGFSPERVGYGAGTRDPKDVPNVLRAVLGRAATAATSGAESVIELATNVDHLAPTALAVAMERALEAGALDAFVVPCTMKKGRSGHLVVALATAATREAVEAALFRETGTLGIRRRVCERTVLERTVVTALTPFGDIRVKLGTYGGEITSAVPEHDDCRAAAERAGVAVAVVSDAARAAWLASKTR